MDASAGSTKIARVWLGMRPSPVNMTRVVSPGAGAGRTATRVPDPPTTASAASTCWASGTVDPVAGACSSSA